MAASPRVILFAAGALIMVSSACSDGDVPKAAVAKPVTESIASGTSNAPVTPSTTSTTSAPDLGPAVDPRELIGEVTMTGESFTNLCSDATSDPATDLLPGGRLLLICSDGETVMFNALNGWEIWRLPSPGEGSDIEIGTRHLFVLNTVQHEATDLQDSYLTRTLNAVDLATGQQSWETELENWIPPEQRGKAQENLYVLESGGAGTGLAPQVGVNVAAWSGLDADTGELLWKSRDIGTGFEDGTQDVTYVGDGMAIGLSTSAVPNWTALHLATGKELWTISIPPITSGEDIILQGDTLWQENDDGVLAVDARSGKTRISRLFPVNWSTSIADHQLVLALDGDRLSLASLSSPSKPLWTRPAGTIEPLAVSESTAVVAAESGVQLLDARTGELTGPAPVEDTDAASWAPVVDGLVRLSDGSIFMLSPPQEKP